MGIQADDLSGGSLTGTIQVVGGQLRFDQTVNPIDFEGTKVFNISFRRDNENGAIIYRTANITLSDTSEITDCAPNVLSLYEGRQVKFAITSENTVSSNITLYYSTAGNVNYNDFVNGNVGYFYLLNGSGNVVLTANSDLSTYADAGEQFNLQIRLASTTGDVIFTSANAVNLIDSSNAIGITSIELSNPSIYYGQAITFTTTAFVPEGSAPVYWSLEGNAQVDNNVSGQLIFADGSNVLAVTTTAGTSPDAEIYLTIRRDSVEGPVIATSNIANVLYVPIIEATGGTTYISDGYKYHLFTTGSSFAVTSSSPIAPINTIQYIAVAGGGGGGAKRGGGGGAGGLVTGSLSASPTTSITISVGGGGAGGVSGEGTRGVNGTPTTLTGSVSATATAGGSGGCGGPFPSPSFTGDGAPGGSGGGGGRNDGTPAIGGSGTPGQGNPAGGTPSGFAGSGGGGFGAAGSPSLQPSPTGPAGIGGAGGNGTAVYNPWFTNSPLGSVDGIAGGGGGGGPSSWPGPTGPNPPGGLGGGGRGGSGTNAPPAGYSTSGRVNSGGGGGGGGNSTNPGPGTGGNGGAGLVILRYPITL